MDVLVAIIILVAVLIGFAVGWYLAKNGGGEAERLLRQSLDGVTGERDLAIREREGFRAERDTALLDLRALQVAETERERAARRPAVSP